MRRAQKKVCHISQLKLIPPRRFKHESTSAGWVQPSNQLHSLKQRYVKPPPPPPTQHHLDGENSKPKRSKKSRDDKPNYAAVSLHSRTLKYEWQRVPIQEFMEELDTDVIECMRTDRLPGGPERVDNALFAANVPNRYRSAEEKRKEHERLMAVMRQETEVVAMEQAKNNWRRDAPDKLRRWQRDYIQMQLLKESKRQMKEMQRIESMHEVEKRFQRRTQGLPESDEEEERLPWHSHEIVKRKKKKPKQIQPPPYNSLWVKRPRDITSMYIQGGARYAVEEEHEDEEQAEEEQAEEEEELVEVEPVIKPEKTEAELQAREEQRLGRFYKYVEKRVPRFEHPADEGEEEEGASELVQQAPGSSKLVTQLVKREYEIPPLVPGRGSLLVASLYDILKEGMWDEEKVAVLHKFKYAMLLPYQVCEVLKRLKDWRVALGFFRWCQSIPKFRHDTLNYSTMIKILGTCGNYVEGQKLFDEMKENGIPPDVFTMNNLMKCYGSGNRIDDAVALYEKLPTFNCEPDICTYALLIDLLGKAGRVKEVRNLFFDIQRRNLKADSYVFNSMIANFGRWKEIKMATEVAEHMKLSGIAFSTVTYAILLNMYAKSMKFFLAEKLYREYLASHLAPDLYVYNNAMHFLGLACRCREAEWVMEDIERAGLTPDKFSYCTIISAWARQGCATDARKWFDKARSRGITPSPEMCNALIDAYIKCLNLEPIGDILDSMPGWGVQPTLQTYTYLFNYYSECSRDFVPVLRDYMRRTNHPAEKFLDDVFEGRVPLEKLKDFSRGFFESVRLEKSGWASKFADAAVHYLQTYGYVREAHAVFEAAAAARLFKRNLWENLDDNWHIWLAGMEEGTALIGLSQGLLISRGMVLKGCHPATATVITGFGKHKNTRTALAVRSALKELESPFMTDQDVAKLVSNGYMFEEWLLGTKIEVDIPFNHPGYVYPPNTRICLRLMNT